MSLYQIEHPSDAATVIQAAGLVVHDGYLHAMRYGGAFEPGRSECEASWAPGQWLSYRRATSCPKCGRETSQFD